MNNTGQTNLILHSYHQLPSHMIVFLLKYSFRQHLGKEELK